MCIMLSSSVFTQTKNTSVKPKPKTIPKIETQIVEIEATTKDGKKVILRSNGTWDYAKIEGKGESTDLPSKKLSVPFIADDIKQVIVFLEKNEARLKKSEYETEKEFSNRLSEVQYEAATTKKLFTDISFRFTLNKEYNAETETFTFKLYNSLNYRAFSELLLVRPRGNEFRIYEPSLNFKIPRERAREISSNLEIAVFGYPVKIDSSYSDKRLLFLLKRISVFNQETGEIYYELEDFDTLTGF